MQCAVLLLTGWVAGGALWSPIDVEIPSPQSTEGGRQACSDRQKDPHVTKSWGGWATVTLRSESRGQRELAGVSLQECTTWVSCTARLESLCDASFEAGRNPYNMQ